MHSKILANGKKLQLNLKLQDNQILNTIMNKTGIFIVFSACILICCLASTKLSHNDAVFSLTQVSIVVSRGPGNCTNKQNSTCVSLDQVFSHAIEKLKDFKRSSNCPITVVGGTEIGMFYERSAFSTVRK